MATKKQQRRRQKERRHDYEYVWVDAEGNELDEAPEESAKPKPAKAAAATVKKGQPPRSRSGRPMREVKPPSWRRAVKRIALLVPLMALFLIYTGRNHRISAGVILVIAMYAVLFVPMFYWIDRAAYRRYLRATGQPDPTARAPKS